MGSEFWSNSEISDSACVSASLYMYIEYLGLLGLLGLSGGCDY